MFLAMIMVFSTFAIGASATYAEYKDENIKEYDSIDKPVFTSAQLASIALDAIDGMLSDLDETSIKIPVINATINYSSIDNALNSLADIYNTGLWDTVKAIAGEVGKNLTFAALNVNPNGNFAANGCRRDPANGGPSNTTDLDVLYSVLAFLNDNSDLLASYGYGTLDLGPTLTGLLGDSIAEYLDAPLLIRTLLYDLAYGDDATPYEDLATKPTIDEMLQIIIDDLLIDLEDELEESFEYGITYDFSNLVDIDSGSFYDQFESILQYAYNEFLVPWGNTKIKEWIYDLAQADYDESQKSYRYELDEDGNQVLDEDGNPIKIKVGYYMDDTAYFQNIRKAPYIYDANAQSVYEVNKANKDNETFQEIDGLINLNYVIPEHNFQPGEQFLTNFNNILKEWLDVMVTAKTPELVWESGSNDMIITNLVNNAKKLLKVYGERFLGEYITIPSDEEIDALTLESAVIRFGREIIEKYATNILLPDSADTVREILSYALCELIADLVPEEDVYTKLTTGQLNPEGDQGWKAVLAIIARYYANAYTNMNIPAGLDFEATISHAVDWALENYGGILYYTSQIDKTKTAWQKLDEVLFTLIPMNYLPAQMRVADGTGSKYISIQSSEDIVLDWLLGNILDLRIEHIFDVFDRNAAGELNGTLSNVLISRVTAILNAIIPGAIPAGLTNFDQIATNSTLGGIIKGLLSGLYSVRENLIPGALPLVSMILGLTGDQELEDPSIDYPNTIISDTLSLSGTEFVVRNNSTGVNTAYRTAEQMGTADFEQDALYQVRIKSITTNVPNKVSVSVSGEPLLNGGEDKTFPVTGKLDAEGLVRFAVTYEILDENEESLTKEPITTYHFTYVGNKVTDEDGEAVSYDQSFNGEYWENIPKVWVDGEGANNHYIVNAPASFIGSSRGWSAIDNLDFGYGRTSTDANMLNYDAVTTKTGLTVNGQANNGILVPEENFKPLTTQYGGYYGSIDFFDVVVPMVTETDEEGKPVEKEADLADYAGTYDIALSLSVTSTFDPSEAPTAFTVNRKLVVYNDYNLYSIVSSAVGTNRQQGNYATSGTFTVEYKDEEGNDVSYQVNAAGKWDAYLEALTEAQAIVLLPKRMDNFDATVYEAAAEKLTKAIRELDACAEGAGVGSLEEAYEAVEHNEANEGKEYDDPDYFFFADADYILYTYNRYADHRSNMRSLINSQYVEEPAEDATQEEIDAYNKAVENIPVLTLFEITYRGHMYTMNAERLVAKEVTEASKNYLKTAYNLVERKYLAIEDLEIYSDDSLAALDRAFAFADDVIADKDYDELKQSKINTARRELIQAYKGLTLKGADKADYTQLIDAIAAADEIFAVEGFEEMYTGIEELLAAYEEATNVDPELTGEEGQAIVDELAAALVAALEGLTKIKASLEVLDPSENPMYDGIEWAPIMSDMAEPDWETEETYRFISGLIFDYSVDEWSLIVEGKGGLDVEFEANANNAGSLATGDKLLLSDGSTVYFVLYGDANGDGVVDGLDIGEAADMFNWASGYASPNNPYFYGADIVADGAVDGIDIAYMADMFNWAIDPYSIPQDGSFQG